MRRAAPVGKRGPVSDCTRKRVSPGRRSSPHGELYRDSRGDWRWRVRAHNGRILAESGEGYGKRIRAHRMLERAMDGFGCSYYEVL